MKKCISLLIILMCIMLIGCDNKIVKNITDKAEEIKSTVTHDKKLSKNIYDFQMKIDGKKFKVPEKFTDYEKDGWKLDGNDNEKVPPNKFTSCYTLKKGKQTLSVQFYNTASDTLKVKKCKVCGVIIDDTDLDTGLKFELPKGINNSSTKSDVIKAYGKPTDDQGRFCEYAINAQRTVQFTFNDKDKKIDSIDMTNMAEDYETSDDEEDTEGESKQLAYPGAVKYTAPRALGDNILSMNIKLAGRVYNIPAPVQEFKKDGWNVDVSGSNVIESFGSSYGVTLKKGKSTLVADIQNLSEKAGPINNCSVVEIEANEDSNRELVLPKNITIGLTKDDIEKAYNGVKYKKDEDKDSIVYTFTTDCSDDNNMKEKTIKIQCNADDGKAIAITVEYLYD